MPATQTTSDVDDFWNRVAGRFAGATLENFVEHGTAVDRENQRRVIQALRAVDLKESIKAGQNILFVGPVGTGKDHLMHSLLRSMYLAHGLRFQLWSGAALRRQLQSAARSDEGDAYLIERMATERLVCLSDPLPGTGEALSPYQADALGAIVDQRWRNRLPTWATCNLPSENTRDAAERILTAPVWDRLKDGSLIVRCNWGSYRKHAEVIE